MNRIHDPCRCCARFLPTGGQKLHEDGPGLCEVDGQPKHSTDHPCPLYVERGSRAARLLAKNDQQLLVELQRRHPETISRASASPSPVSRGRQPERQT